MRDWNPFAGSDSSAPRSDGGKRVSRSAPDQDRDTLEREIRRLRDERDEAQERAARLETELATERTRTEAFGDAIEDLTVVEFWHAMGGEKAMLLEELAREFESQTDGIRIALASKGSYRGTLDAALAGARDGSPPAIAQIFGIGTTRARDSNYFRPIEQLLSREHVDSLLDPVTNYYRFDGTLHSVPFNASNPILAYNRDAFEAAGLDPEQPPETLEDVRNASKRLVDAGVSAHGITSANYSWFVEQWFAEADELLVDQDNGRSGTPTTSALDGPFARSLFEWWTEVEAEGYYYDPGIEARGAARSAFHDGEAAMLVGSTSSLTTIEGDAKFDVGTGRFPVVEERTGVLVGGASLWVGADRPDAVHEAVGEFLTWLTEPDQQQRWHRETGYFPVHEEAIPKLRESGWFEENHSTRRRSTSSSIPPIPWRREGPRSVHSIPFGRSSRRGTSGWNRPTTCLQRSNR